RNLSQRVLAEYGYRVITARDGEAALKLFQEHVDAIQIIITDVIMPKKSGREFYDEARKINPKIKVIFTSGYPSDLIQKEGLFNKDHHFLTKPASPQTLLQKVREVLDQPPPG
ncbi:MAG TPA: response regulator, partial [Nitrospirota bacterium]